MSWTIVKINARDTKEKYLEEELEVDNWKNLDFSDYKLLKKLDPYGDTTFKADQLDDLKLDLEKLSTVINSNALTEIIALIDECKGEVDSYLRFYGD